MTLRPLIMNQMSEKKAIRIADDLFRLLDIRWAFGEDYPGTVGVQVVAGEGRHAAKANARIVLPGTFS